MTATRQQNKQIYWEQKGNEEREVEVDDADKEWSTRLSDNSLGDCDINFIHRPFITD